MALSPELRQLVLKLEKDEITEREIYRRLAASESSDDNRERLEHIARDENQHYETWKAATGVDVGPGKLRIWWYLLLARVLGITFALKLMERTETDIEETYGALVDEVPNAGRVLADENTHERVILNMLDEEALRYTGAIVLGLNDALVELTGTLAGLTLALQNTRVTAAAASITGIAAALSMGASEYLAERSQTSGRAPLRAGLYTGISYFVAVIFLVLPYVLLTNYYIALALTLAIAVLIIAGFTFYESVARGEVYKRRFGEMAALSLSIAAFSFGIGYVIRHLFGVKI